MPAFRDDARSEIVALCGRSAERTQEAACRLGIPRPCHDWRELVADPEIDVVSIAVPPPLQPVIVEAAARAGKHVFCEKPIGDDLATVMQTVAAVQGAGVVHAVNFIFPELEPWQHAKTLIDTESLGRLRSATLSWRTEIRARRKHLASWKLRREEGGGVVTNFVSHTMHYLEWLFGRIARVAARLRPRLPSTEAEARLWLVFASGLEMSVDVADDALFGDGHHLAVYGDNGRLVLRNESPDDVSRFEVLIGTRGTGKVTLVADAGVPAAGDGRIAPTRAIIGRLLDAISARAIVTPNLEHGLRVQTLLDAVRRADERDSWEPV